MDICLEYFKPPASNVKEKIKRVLDAVIKKLKDLAEKIAKLLHIGKKSENKEAEHKDVDKNVAKVKSEGPSGLTPEQLQAAKYRAIGPYYKKAHWEEAAKSCKISSYVDATDAGKVGVRDMDAIYNTAMNLIKFLKDIGTVTPENADDLVDHVTKTVKRCTENFTAKTDEISLYDYFNLNEGMATFNKEIIEYGWEDCECWDSKSFTAQAPKVNILTAEIKKLSITDPNNTLSNEDGEKVITAIGDIASGLSYCLKLISVYVKSYHTAIDKINAYLVRGFREYIKTPEAESILKEKGFDERDGSVSETLFIKII